MARRIPVLLFVAMALVVGFLAPDASADQTISAGPPSAGH